MSKLRKPYTFEDGIHVAVAGLGLEGTAEAIGKSASLVYKFGDPDIECLPSVRQAVLIDAAYVLAGHGAAPLLRAYREQVETAVNIRGGAPAHTPADPVERICKVMRESVEAVDAYRGAIQPGKTIAPVVVTEVVREAAEAITALEDMIRDVEAHAANGVVRPVEAAE